MHQGFATVAPPTAALYKDPGRPEKGNYQVNGTNGTACLLASMGLQLTITFNSVSQNKVSQYKPSNSWLNSVGATNTDTLTGFKY